MKYFILLSLLFLSCNDDDENYEKYQAGSLTADPLFAVDGGAPENYAHYFKAAPYDSAHCSSVMDLKIHREIRIFYHPGLYELKEFSQGLQRYFGRFGLRFFTRFEPLELPIDWIIEEDEMVIQAEMEERFPGVDFSEDALPPDEATIKRINAAIFEVMMSPIIDFARTYGGQGPEITQMVLLPALMNGWGEELEEGIILGLGISQPLIERLQRRGAVDAALWDSFPVEEFSPMFFLNGEILAEYGAEVGEVLIDITAAHEFGHTAGLEHVDLRNNLMNSAVESASDVSCGVALDQEQLETLKEVLGGAPIPAQKARRGPLSREAGWQNTLALLRGERSLFPRHKE